MPSPPLPRVSSGSSSPMASSSPSSPRPSTSSLVRKVAGPTCAQVVQGPYSLPKNPQLVATPVEGPSARGHARGRTLSSWSRPWKDPQLVATPMEGPPSSWPRPWKDPQLVATPMEGPPSSWPRPWKDPPARGHGPPAPAPTYRGRVTSRTARSSVAGSNPGRSPSNTVLHTSSFRDAPGEVPDGLRGIRHGGTQPHEATPLNSSCSFVNKRPLFHEGVKQRHPWRQKRSDGGESCWPAWVGQDRRAGQPRWVMAGGLASLHGP